ncbi:MAG: alpha/beta hydrolase [Trueperaceae bacterium]
MKTILGTPPRGRRRATTAGGHRVITPVTASVAIATSMTIALAVLAGLLTGVLMPRGPVTTAQASIVLVTSFALGAAAGLIMRSRWPMLLTPVAYALAFELARWGAVGPTVDAPRLDSSYGILALLLGRGFHALIALLPMVIGAGFGLTLARYLSGAPARWLPTVFLLLLPAALALWLALPARTPAILGADGKPLSGSVAELTTVRLGGHDQTILIRGHSVDAPVLLYLSGGPGQSDLAYSRVLFADLAKDFVVVGWDQRGTGKSYASLDPAGLTPAQAVSDTIELTDYLRNRFGEDKIYLLGESWGSTLGVLAVQQRPDLYHAYVGSGQMVSQSLTDRRIWRDLLAYAQEAGNWKLYDQLITYGEPPYRDVPYANAFAMTHYDALTKPYAPPQAYVERGSSAGLGPYGIFASEYNLVDKVNVLRGLIDMFAVMYPQLQEIDFRADVPQLEVPVYLLDGQAELAGRRDLALEWYERLDAPIKRLYSFENAAHSVAFEQFEALHDIMTGTVLADTYLEP